MLGFQKTQVATEQAVHARGEVRDEICRNAAGRDSVAAFIYEGVERVGHH